MRWVGFGAVLAWVALTASGAHAESFKDRAQAKKLEKVAKALEDGGDYAGALAKYDEAAALVPLAPSVALHAAECVEKLGHWRDAVARYDALAKADAPATPSKKEAEAQEQARALRDALDKRIPSVTIRIEGDEDVSEAAVALDGQQLARTRIGVKLQVDPGNHLVEAMLRRAGADRFVREPFLAVEGRGAEVVLRVAPKPVEAPAPVVATVDASGDPWDRLKTKSNTQRTAGVVVLGFGGAALAAGIAFNVAAAGVTSGLDDACPNHVCPKDQFAKVDAFRTMKTLAVVGYVAAGALTLTGLSLVLTASDAHRKTEALRIEPQVGLASIGVAGRFR